MKQVFNHRGEAIVVDVEEPTVGPTDVLIDLAWSTISPGTETTQLRQAPRGVLSRLWNEPGATKVGLQRLRNEGSDYALSVLRKTDVPDRPLGYSCSGRVRALGHAVSDLSPGDLVAAAGPGFANHAEVVAVPRSLVTPIPACLGMREASSVALGGIALHAVRRAEARLGENIAVIGLGYIGQFIAQGLASAGCSVLAIDPLARRLERAQSYCNRSFCGTAEAVLPEVRERCGDQGIDTIIVTADAETGALQAAAEMVRHRGRIVQVGVGPVALSYREFWLKELDVLSSRSYGPGFEDPSYEVGNDYPQSYVRWTLGRNFEEYFRQLERGRMNARLLVDREFKITEAPQAYYSFMQDDPPPLGALLRYPFADHFD